MTINFQTSNQANSPYKSFYAFVEKNSEIQPERQYQDSVATVSIGDIEDGSKKTKRDRKKLFGIIGKHIQRRGMQYFSIDFQYVSETLFSKDSSF